MALLTYHDIFDWTQYNQNVCSTAAFKLEGAWESPGVSSQHWLLGFAPGVFDEISLGWGQKLASLTSSQWSWCCWYRDHNLSIPAVAKGHHSFLIVLVSEGINDIDEFHCRCYLLGKAQELSYMLVSISGKIEISRTSCSRETTISYFSSSLPLPLTCPSYVLIKQIALTFLVYLNIILENWCPMWER